MDRKYKQQGYQDDSKEPTREKRPKRDRDGPRSPSMMTFQGVLRCSMCGHQIELVGPNLSTDSTCVKCGSDLHTCRNCKSFDPASRRECRQPIPKRIPNKNSNNECELFNPNLTVEKRTGETKSSKPDDPKSAFERLFKS